LIPVDAFKLARAATLDLVIRQVTQVSGAATDCDHFSGSVSVPQISDGTTNKYAIDSHVVGCGLSGGGGPCNPLQTNFLDSTQPVFSPDGASSFFSVRLPRGATCETVRKALP
ncbi:MAG: hypothetical protein ACREJ3_04460, partial [Polyangiaceae bacterium]